MEILSSFFLLFSLLSLSSTQADHDTALPGTISRTTKQQLLTTLQSGSPTASQPFLSSPSGKYSAYFLRHITIPGAGGFGNDFCYIQVVDTGTADSMWESECAPVSTLNACSLVFSDSGLEIFDGSNSAWSTDAQSESPLQSIELVDAGDMRIRDDEGELAWKASDDARQNQECGQPGSPGLATAVPPFAQPIGQSSEMPFGQQQSGGATGRVAPIPEGGNGEGVGFGGLPLVDSTPYDSGSLKEAEGWAGLGGSVLIMAFGGILF